MNELSGGAAARRARMKSRLCHLSLCRVVVVKLLPILIFCVALVEAGGREGGRGG